MDINFHYYAIKQLAVEAGFCDDDAQIIAEYSQFIDDYTEDKPFKTTNVPPKTVIDAKIATLSQGDIYDVESIPTGFDILYNKTDLLKSDFQKRVLVPFHFILPYRLIDGDNSKNLCTIPAKLNDDQIISKLLDEVYNMFVLNGRKLNIEVLIKIGCLAHVFADTYAHEGFSGLNMESNNYKIVSCKKLIFDEAEDVTAKEQSLHVLSISVLGYKRLPNLGHTTVGHVVDYTNASYCIAHNSDTTKYYTRTRDNYTYFLQPLEKLFTYFAKFTTTQKRFDPLVYQYGFKVNYLDIKDLNIHWECVSEETDDQLGEELFKPVNFHKTVFSYSKENMLNRLKKVRNVKENIYDVFQEYWIFTEFAKHIRDSAVQIS